MNKVAVGKSNKGGGVNVGRGVGAGVIANGFSRSPKKLVYMRCQAGSPAPGIGQQ